MDLVLSLFPGVGLLDRSFERAGFVVVQCPDLITGGDVRRFTGIEGRFDGVIGGPPCQGFSAANRSRNQKWCGTCHRVDSGATCSRCETTLTAHPSVVNSRGMVGEFSRIVAACQPTWWLMENVPAVPDVRVAGFASVQRLALTDEEVGGVQIRSRHFQFGHRLGHIIRPIRSVKPSPRIGRKAAPTMARAHSKWLTFRQHCERQGIEPLALPGWSKTAKFQAVGNGVPRAMGDAIAAAVKRGGPRTKTDCPCGCGRVLTGRQKSATATCRKWLELARKGERDWVDEAGFHVGTNSNGRAMDLAGHTTIENPGVAGSTPAPTTR